MIHELPLDRRTLHGHFSRDLEPVLTIEPGDAVRFATPNSGWWLDDETRFEPRSSPEDDGHALAGPIEVRGARPGQTLVVRIDEVTPQSFAKRVLADQRLQLADQLRVSTGLDLGGATTLQRADVFLAQPNRLGRQARVHWNPAERIPGNH